MAEASKAGQHEDERKLGRDPNLKGRVEAETAAPQKQEWPEETPGEESRVRPGKQAVEADEGMRGQVAAERNPREANRSEEGSAEAKAARGIDVHESEPGKTGGSERQPVEAPTEKLDRVSSYEGSLSGDREGRKAPDLVEKGTERGMKLGPNETSGSEKK